jgi:hypothetical protein
VEFKQPELLMIMDKPMIEKIEKMEKKVEKKEVKDKKKDDKKLKR